MDKNCPEDLIPLGQAFYLRDTCLAARQLLGKYLVRRLPEGEIIGRITETEAYVGSCDKACHAYGGRMTERTKIMYGPGGHAYIYMIYGMYYCLNFVTGDEGDANAVLIRGVQLVQGAEMAARFRYGKPMGALTGKQLRQLSDGPGKVCRALALTRAQNGEPLFVPGGPLEVRQSSQTHAFDILVGPRVGIDYAEEARDFLWRYRLVDADNS